MDTGFALPVRSLTCSGHRPPTSVPTHPSLSVRSCVTNPKEHSDVIRTIVSRHSGTAWLWSPPSRWPLCRIRLGARGSATRSLPDRPTPTGSPRPRPRAQAPIACVSYALHPSSVDLGRHRVIYLLRRFHRRSPPASRFPPHQPPPGLETPVAR